VDFPEHPDQPCQGHGDGSHDDGTRVALIPILTCVTRGITPLCAHCAADEPNLCVGGANGEFTADTGFAGRDVTKAYSTGVWPARQPANCRLPGGGRLGQDTTMVPAGVTSLTICTNSGRVIKSGYESLVSALNKLPISPSNGTCISHGHGVTYQLLFSYPAGPPAVVDVASACSPPIDNLSAQADSTGSVLPIIQQLLNKH